MISLQGQSTFADYFFMFFMTEVKQCQNRAPMKSEKNPEDVGGWRNRNRNCAQAKCSYPFYLRRDGTRAKRSPPPGPTAPVRCRPGTAQVAGGDRTQGQSEGAPSDGTSITQKRDRRKGWLWYITSPSTCICVGPWDGHPVSAG